MNDLKLYWYTGNVGLLAFEHHGEQKIRSDKSFIIVLFLYFFSLLYNYTVVKYTRYLLHSLFDQFLFNFMYFYSWDWLWEKYSSQIKNISNHIYYIQNQIPVQTASAYNICSVLRWRVSYNPSSV